MPVTEGVPGGVNGLPRHDEPHFREETEGDEECFSHSIFIIITFFFFFKGFWTMFVARAAQYNISFLNQYRYIAILILERFYRTADSTYERLYLEESQHFS